MNKKIVSFVLLSFLLWMLLSLSLLVISRAQPQGIVIGVKKDDWVKYGKISATWESEQMEPDREHMELNNILWFKHEVLDVTNSGIVSNQTTQFKNGTQKSSVILLHLHTHLTNRTSRSSTAHALRIVVSQ